MKTVIIGGMAGYVAERILGQQGFEVYNLAGGYRSMDAIEKAISG